MPRYPLLLTLAAFSAAAAVALVSACASDSSSSSSSVSDSDAATDAPALDAKTKVLDEDGAAGNDGGTETSTCELTRAYVLDCNAGPDAGDQLTCGPSKFDAWCALNDKAINSESYRRAEALCLTHKNCDGLTRRDCEYRTYATATPTTAQQQVAAAYCQTCEPADQAGCVARKTKYNPALGPKSTDDVFVAAWELSDSLDDAIRTKCTGSALDAGAGPDAAACLKAFANCAGDLYVNALPDCP